MVQIRAWNACFATNIHFVSVLPTICLGSLGVKSPNGWAIVGDTVASAYHWAQTLVLTTPLTRNPPWQN